MKRLKIKKNIYLMALIVGVLMMALFTHGELTSQAAMMPTANLVATPTSGTAPLQVSFTLTVGPDSDSECNTSSYKLEFGEGSSIASGQAGTYVFGKIYGTPGVYTAVLTYTIEVNQGSGSVVDCQEQTTTDSVQIRVDRALDPINLVFNVTPKTASPGFLVGFNIFGSTTDVTCQNTQVDWDFGDGTVLLNQAIAHHGYEKVGTYTATVTWTDGCGRVATAQEQVIIELPKAPAPGDGGSGAAPVQTTTYTITVSDGANNSVEPLGDCSIAPIDSGDGCFAFAIDMRDEQDQAAGKIVIMRETIDIFDMGVISPDNSSAMSLVLCLEGVEESECQSSGAATRDVEEITVQLDFAIYVESDEALNDALAEVSTQLEAQAPELLLVMERFSGIGDYLEQNPDEYDEFIEFLIQHSSRPDSEEGIEFGSESGVDWETHVDVLCVSASCYIRSAVGTAAKWNNTTWTWNRDF